MNEAVRIINEKKIEATVKALNKNNFIAKYVSSKEELLEEIKALVPKGATTASGGSQTNKDLGVEELIRSNDYKYMDRKAPFNTAEEERQVLMNSTFVDYYFMSSQAITEKGELYNVDGFGNRVSALLFGPKNVVVIAGVNKIVKDLDAAIERNRAIAAPMNCARLEKKNPCTITGRCQDCRGDDRICIDYVHTGFQRVKGRIKVFILNEELGF